MRFNDFKAASLRNLVSIGLNFDFNVFYLNLH